MPVGRSSGTSNGKTSASHSRRSSMSSSMPPSLSMSTMKPPSNTASARSSVHNSPAIIPQLNSARSLNAVNLDESPSPVDIDMPNAVTSAPARNLSSSTLANSISSLPPVQESCTDIPLPPLPLLSPAAEENQLPNYAPITPASLMNLPPELSLLSGLSPVIHPENHQASAGLPQPTFALPGSMSNAKVEKKKPQPKKAALKNDSKGKRAARVSIHEEKLTDAFKDDDADDVSPENRKTSHKAAEQRRRDSLKLCFEELRHILPFIPPEDDEESGKRPGEGNVGGQRSGVIDFNNPNKGVSKVALLRKSNQYIGKLQSRVDRRNQVIETLRNQLLSLGVQPVMPLVSTTEGETYPLDPNDMDVTEMGSWPHPQYVALALYGEGGSEDEETQTAVNNKKTRRKTSTAVNSERLTRSRKSNVEMLE